jgi:hypothetical protein
LIEIPKNKLNLRMKQVLKPLINIKTKQFPGNTMKKVNITEYSN